jgi:hypothetical protein
LRVISCAVEKLFHAKFAKIKLRQDAVSDLLGSQDIFYPVISDHLSRKETFSTATPADVNYESASRHLGAKSWTWLVAFGL